MRKTFHPGSSLAALTVALCALPQTAQANGFLGTPTVQSGSVTFDRIPTNSETITVASPRAIINWVPDDNTGTAPFTFLPNGNSVNYVAASTPYVVLNRIVPANTSRAAIFDGLVTDVSGGNGIWFYTPGGFIIGSNARFNVGNTVLSTGDFAETAGEFFPGSTSFSVSNAVDSTATIAINPGAQFNATAANSFVVAVAPRISSQGTITVNGTAALVAAEAVDFTYNAGLFDITTTRGVVGNGVNPVLEQRGSITGPASSGAGDNHRIYMVAVPKNDAISMLIQSGGQIGFDVAGAANVDGNTIVLSTGHNVRGVAAGTGDPFVNSPASIAQTDLNIGDNNFTSNVFARSNGPLRAYGNTVSGLNFASNFSARAARRGGIDLDIATFAGGTITVAGNLTGSVDEKLANGLGRSATAGFAQIHSDTGTITVGGNLILTADAEGDLANFPGVTATGNSQGGTAALFTNSGAISVAGTVLISANATVNDSGVGILDGGNAVAGLPSIFANNGSITIGGQTRVQGLASGGVGFGGDGGRGTGSAAASIAASGISGTVVLTGGAIVDASATGGTALSGPNAVGGSAVGGDARVVANADSVITADFLILDSNGFASSSNGVGTDGGDGTGGTASISQGTGGRIAVATLADISASGAGGTNMAGGDGIGGIGRGGDVRLVANSTTSGGPAISIGGSAQLFAIGGGGSGGTATVAGSGGAGIGGLANVGSQVGVVNIAGNAQVVARGVGGNALSSGSGGNATGGSALIGIINGAAAEITIGNTAFALANAIAGSAVGAGNRGGNATGGFGQIFADSGIIGITNQAFAAAVGSGGAGSLEADGGTATGGLATFTAGNGTTTGQINLTGTLSVRSDASSGAIVSGAGSSGAATGGTSTIAATLAASRIDVDGAVTIDSQSTTGAVQSGNAGLSTGGQARILGTTGVIDLASTAELFATATGGLSTGGTGGAAAGGFVHIQSNQSGRVTIAGNVDLRTNAVAGNGVTGGAATGGRGFTTSNTNGLLEMRSNVNLAHDARGGDGTTGNGGNASAGLIPGFGVSAQTGGTTRVLGNFTNSINGTGGNSIGGNGGEGRTLSSANLFANASTVQVSGSFSGQAIGTGGSISGSGVAGNGFGGNGGLQTVGVGSSISVGGAISLILDGVGGSGTALSPTGGSGTGGFASVLTNTGTLALTGTSLTLVASGRGGIAASGGIGTGGRIAVGAQTGGSLTVAGSSFLTANGLGGNAISGRGGDGLGSTSFSSDVFVTEGGTASFGSITIAADAVGGTGGVGASGGGTGGRGGNGIAGRGATVGSGSSAGTMTTGSLVIFANGVGGAGGAGGSGATGGVGGAGGNGTGGQQVGAGTNDFTAATSAGTFLFGNITARADGTGGAGGVGGSGTIQGNGGAGGAGQGGLAGFGAPGGTVQVTGVNNFVSATGFGGAGGAGTAFGNGGNGTGGIHQSGARVNALNGFAGVVTVNGGLNGGARGVGGVSGTGGRGGDAVGGQSFTGGNGGTATFNGNVLTPTTAIGGAGGTGGNATGGSSLFRALNGGTVNVVGALTVSGSALAGSATDLGASSGNGTGGNHIVAIEGGSRMSVAGALDVLAFATTGSSAGGSGGTIRGGTASLQTNSAADVGVFGGNITLRTQANALGSTFATNGAAAFGGTSQILVTAGDISTSGSAADVSLEADAIGTAGATGGDATGGTARIQLLNGGRFETAGFVDLKANAQGGTGVVANGGNASGGLAEVVSATGTATTFSSSVGVTIDAGAEGGFGTAAGGAATGGTARLASFAPGSLLSVGSLNIDTGGFGGFGGTGAGGAALGGFTDININGGSVSATDGFLTAPGIGGSGATGGNGVGGTANVSVTNGSFTLVSPDRFDIVADADGGAGSAGNGGNATGGNARLRSGPGGSGSILIDADLNIDADATGGNADGSTGNGGNATAGFAGLVANQVPITVTGATLIEAFGIGGDGVNGGNVVTPAMNAPGAFVSSENTTLSLGDLNVDVTGFGGNGRLGGTGGNASAARFTLNTQDGNVVIPSIIAGGNLTVFANADGGSGGDGLSGAIGGNGGAGGSADGFNHQILARATNGQVTFGDIVFDGEVNGGRGGAGGAGSSGAGGAGGIGGSAGRDFTTFLQIGTFSGAGAPTIQGFNRSNSITAFFSSVGNDGGASGLGTTDGAAGAGGTAAGGGLTLLARGSEVTSGAVFFNATAIGGNGGVDRSGAIAGAGGNATGGNAIILASPHFVTTTETATVNLDSFTVNASGNGGLGGATGGNATGGEAAIRLEENGAVVTRTAVVNIAGDISLIAPAIGGSVSTGTGGTGTGGLARIDVLKGNVTIGGNAEIGAVGLGGDGSIGGAASGGNAFIKSVEGSFAIAGDAFVGAFSIGGTSFAGPLAATAYGRAFISADGPGSSLGSLNLIATGDTLTSVAPVGGVTVSGIAARNGTLAIGGFVTTQLTGDAALFTDNATIAVNQFNFASEGNIVGSLDGVAAVNPGTVRSTGNIAIAAGLSLTTQTRFASALSTAISARGDLSIGGVSSLADIVLTSGGEINGGDIVTDDLFEVVTAGNLTFGSIRAESDIDLTAGGNVITGALSTGDSVLIGAGGSVTTGNIDAGTINPIVDPQAGYGVGIQAVGNVVTGTIAAQGPIGLGSQTGSVTAGAIQNQDSLLVLARTGVETGAITTAADGAVYIADAAMISLLDPVTLDPAPIFAATPVSLAGPVTIGGAVATNRFVSASAGGFTAQAGIQAPASVFVSSGATASFNGPVSSTVIGVSSADIVIGANGTLGSRLTQALGLSVDPAATAVAFGGGTIAGYSLSGDEASRLQAQSISFTMQMTATQPVPRLALGSFTLRGDNAGQQANLTGTQGRLRIVTPGAIAITGAGLITDAVAGNLVEIVAGGRIEIDANGGAIRMTNGADPAGVLRLAASDIWSADASTLAALRDNVDFAGRDARLGQAVSTRDPQQVLLGGTINLFADDTILIANTGNFATRGGFDAGPGGLTVAARVGTPGRQTSAADLPPGTIDVVINGRGVDSAGVALTNQRTIEAVTISSGTTLTDSSSVNGCVIATSVCASAGQGDPISMASIQAATEPQALTEMAEEERKEAEEAVAASEKRPSAVISRLIEGANITNDDVIDEPVSGGGNPSLWEALPSGEPQ